MIQGESLSEQGWTLKSTEEVGRGRFRCVFESSWGYCLTLEHRQFFGGEAKNFVLFSTPKKSTVEICWYSKEDGQKGPIPAKVISTKL